MVTEIKKKKVTYETVKLKDCHRGYDKMTDKGESWKNRDGDCLILGIKLKWIDYEDVAQEETSIVVCPKTIKDDDIDQWIKDNVILVFENNIQNKEIRRLQDEIQSKDEYEV